MSIESIQPRQEENHDEAIKLSIVQPPVLSEDNDSESFVINDVDDSQSEKIRNIKLSEDSVKDYLGQTARTPLLNAEEEVELSKRIEAGLLAGSVVVAREKARGNQELSEDEQKLFDRWRGKVATDQLAWIAKDGDKAKNNLIEANLRLVVSISKRYQGRGLDLIDLIQEGNTGLIRAVEKFDYTKGFKFSTYGTWWIRQAITRGIADQARTIRVPVHAAEVINKISRAEHNMLQDLGREPTPEELAKEIDMTPEKISEIKKLSREPISLQAPLGDGHGRGQTEGFFGDLIEDSEAITASEMAEKSERQHVLDEALDSLDYRTGEVLRMRFGFYGDKSYTLDEVGAVFKITKERARQIAARGMKTLGESHYADSLRELID